MENVPEWLDAWVPGQIPALRLTLATIFGGIIGLERETRQRPAGLRTYAIVSLAAALFTVLTFEILENVEERGGRVADPIRVVEAVTSGVAFIAAGAIIRGAGGRVRGLTTGAGLWLAGAIGVACALGEYGIAAMTTLLALILLRGIKLLE